MKKLTSRKLWCAVISTALAIGALFFAPEVMGNIEQLLVMLSPILVYILGQSAVDCCAALKDKPTQEAQETARRGRSTHGEKGDF